MVKTFFTSFLWTLTIVTSRYFSQGNMACVQNNGNAVLFSDAHDIRKC